MRSAVRLVALAVLYFVAAKAGLKLAFAHPSATAIWPPTGLALAALILGGSRLWPAVFAGAFLANVTTAGSIATSLGIAAGNTLEALLGTYLAHRFCGGREAFDRPWSIFRWTLLVGLFSTLLSASVGVASLALGGFTLGANPTVLFRTWWLGDVGGALLVAPLLLLWARRPGPRWRARQIVELFAVALALLLPCAAMFGVPFPLGARTYPLAFAFFPMLAWAGFRLDPRATITIAAETFVFALWGTLDGHGAFVVLARSKNESLLFLQAFLCVTTSTSLALAAAVSEWRRARDEVMVLNRELNARVGDAEAAADRARDLYQISAAVAAENARLYREAQAAVTAREEFLSIASHELRTPLTSLRLQVKIVERALVAALATGGGTYGSLERVLEAVTILGEDSQRLVRLVGGLLDVTRISAGRLELDLERFDFREAVSSAIDPLRTELAQREIALTIDAPEPAFGSWDRLRVEQVVTNLVGNAMKFGEGKPISVRVFADGGDVVLLVKDQGIGIDAPFLERIFGLFDRGASTERAGLGIGLYVARQIAEAHGGSIHVSSELGRGATFVVRLPRRAETTNAPGEGVA